MAFCEPVGLDTQTLYQLNCMSLIISDDVCKEQEGPSGHVLHVAPKGDGSSRSRGPWL